MRWAHLFIGCLMLAFTLAGSGAPLLASDLERPYSAEKLPEGEELAEFCYGQRQICRKICNLRSRFEDRFDGCPSSCESREIRCGATGCYRWSEQEFLIAERFGGFKCAL